MLTVNYFKPSKKIKILGSESRVHEKWQTAAIIREIFDSNLETGRYGPKSVVSQITVNPQFSLLGGLFISSPFEGGGGLNRQGGLIWEGGTMVSVLHKELEYKLEKLKYKTF